ncbi:MAG: hypothetical protein F2534_02560 [Actinobacteria bacterium]|uniref:Unannotated protein n=1 Tax=freshwater metagenome TaxID=449393 RepID=A0A6J6C105_9ZZZZ|nr:hypothetical protein [Actinomycetota bacterium]
MDGRDGADGRDGVDGIDRPAGAPADARRDVQRRWWFAGIASVAVIGVVTALVLASGGDGGSATATSLATSGTVTDPSAAETVPGSVDATTDGTTDPTGPGGEVPASTAPVTVAPLDPAVTVPVVTGTLDTVVVDTVVPAPAVSIDDIAETSTGMSFRIESLEPVDGEANGPGEIAAPSVRVTIVATNGGTAPVLLETVVVDLRSGTDQVPAPPLSGPGGVRFSGSLAPGASATGVYVFDVPVDRRDLVSILVSYVAAVPPVVFEGPAPRPAT